MPLDKNAPEWQPWKNAVDAAMSEIGYPPSGWHYVFSESSSVWCWGRVPNDESREYLLSLDKAFDLCDTLFPFNMDDFGKAPWRKQLHEKL